MTQQSLLSSSRIRRIMITVCVGFLVVIIYTTVTSYNTSIKQAESGSLMRLGGIVNSLALQIDGDLHKKLMQRHLAKDAITDNTQDSVYDHIHQLLFRNHEANMLKTPIYTIVMDSLSSYYAFGVTSAAMPYFRHAYNSAPKELMDKNTEGAMIPMYKDEFGTWLSAFAPIKNRKGEVVAVVQADEKFDLFLARERVIILKNLVFSAVVFVIVLAILIQILRTILAKELRDKEALTKAHAQIQELDNFRKEMITNVSHDLRTPVASIMGFTETLKNKKDSLSKEDQEKYLNIIHSETKRLNVLLRGLFDLSNLESGQIKLDKEPLNMAELMFDMLQKYRIQAQEKNVRLIDNIQSDTPLLEVDIKWMDRVIQNLMDNALKYVNDGGYVKLTLYTEPNTEGGNFLHFKVCNSGEPIPSDLLPHIFDRYFTATKRNDISTGLGLAIVKRVIDLHGGTIWAESMTDLTTFRFRMGVA